jgi:multiple sugar transport system ATP-binding protein
MARVTLEQVSKKYGKTEALKNLSLSIEDGELVTMIGPSGAGKTSTLKIIAGVEPATDGTVSIGGRRVTDWEPAERNVAMAFEDYALYPHMSVHDNIAFPLRAPGANLTDTEIDAIIRRITGFLQIDMLIQRMPRELSGGQKQRVALARTLVRQQADVFLLDEPLSHVDAKISNEVRGEIKRLQATQNLTILYVTHNYREALALGDRIAVINHGVLQQFGTPAEVYSQPINEFTALLIGQPSMSLFECRPLSENGKNYLQIDNGTDTRFEAPPDAWQRIAAKHLTMVKVGVRPQDFDVAFSRPEGPSLSGRTYVFEAQGTRGVLSVMTDRRLVPLLVRPDLKVAMDQIVWLTFDPSRHLFDPETGQRI